MINPLSQFSQRWAIGLASVGAAALLGACDTPNTTVVTDPAQEPVVTQVPETDSPTATAGNTVVDVAAGENDFSILLEAVEAAGLTDALAASGPLTVFAPTNEAFEALPGGTLDQLLLPENQDLLRQVLTYHVLQEEVTSAEITSGEVPTAAGSPLTLQVNQATGEVMANEARVIEADIQASNGVIHAVDQVILPPGLTL
jgi:uncharacterized surface protein with fasciclin (FAS1) repeats